MLDDLLKATEEFKQQIAIPTLLEALYCLDGILADDIVFTETGWEAVEDRTEGTKTPPLPAIRRF